MARRSSKPLDEEPMRRAPALTMEERQNQLIALAMDRAEEQLRDGTASSQVICHYLKLGTAKDRLEQELLEQKSEMLAAKTAAIKAAERTEALYAEAIEAMRKYGGHGGSEEYND